MLEIAIAGINSFAFGSPNVDPSDEIFFKLCAINAKVAALKDAKSNLNFESLFHDTKVLGPNEPQNQLAIGFDEKYAFSTLICKSELLSINLVRSENSHTEIKYRYYPNQS